MKKLFAFLILFFLAQVRPADALVMNGAELVTACDTKEVGGVNRCIGYVAGIIDYQLMMQSLGTVPATDFCLPPDIPIEQVTVAVIEYIRQSPYHQAFIAAPAVALALQEKFPCAAPKKRRR